MEKTTFNINIASFKKLATPKQLRNKIPATKESFATVCHSRKIIKDIIYHKDKRLLAIVGPCSIHDYDLAIDYAKKLRKLASKLKKKLFIVMRCYFEKPRTTVGWKGFVNDPYLDNSFNINDGLVLSRKLLAKITDMGLGVAIEALDPIIPQYLGDLICWTAIGARTTESQTHREMASGLSTPIGFKNSTDGNIQVAINGMKAAMSPHHFLGIDHNGCTCIVQTSGNQFSHLILRGGGGSTNYDSVNISLAENALKKAKLPKSIIVDCSHDNSRQNYQLQPAVLRDCINQIASGNKSIIGVMIESNIKAGKQDFSKKLSYGISITDSCVDFKTTEDMLLSAYDDLAI